MNNENFSYNATTTIEGDGNPTMDLYGRFTETNDYVSQVTSYGSDYTYTHDTYYTIIDGITYAIIGLNGEYTADVADSPMNTTLGGAFGENPNLAGIYNLLSYDEETKTYKVEYTLEHNAYASYEIGFENGKLVKMDVVQTSGSYTIYMTCFDFGTTEVTIPDFTLPEVVRTTVTLDEWLKEMSTKNFSYSADIDSTTTYVGYLYGRYTDTNKYIYQTHDYGNGFAIESTFFYTIIDGITYEIADKNGEFIADVSTSIMDITLGESFGNEPNLIDIYELLVYNEESKSYEITYQLAENSYATYEIGFENGKIVKMNFVQNAGDITIYMTCFDFGTTEVTLPEYTFAEHRKTVTLDEWLEAMKTDNYTRNIELYIEDTDEAQIYWGSILEMFDGIDGFREQRFVGDYPQFGYMTTIDGVQYEITMKGANWVATPDLRSYKIALGYAFGDEPDLASIYELLVYDSDTETYKCQYRGFEGITSSYEIGFENGEITKFDIVQVGDDGTIIYFVCTDFGENDITLPDFTFAE